MSDSAGCDWDAVFLSDEEGASHVEPQIDDEGASPAEPEIDPAAFLDMDPPASEEIADETAVGRQDAVMAAVPQESAPKRGRPHGTFGGQFLRSFQKAAQAEIEKRAEAKRPVPGSIEYAREHKKQRSRSAASTDLVGPGVPASAAAVDSILDAASSMWECLQDAGPVLQQGLAASALYSMKHQSTERETSDCASVLSLKAEAIMSDKALKAALKAKGQSGSIKVDRATVVSAAACVLGGGALWGASLESIRQQVQKGKLRALFFIEKARYDETPLKVRIEGTTASNLARATAMETCQHAKVLQVEASFYMVLQETSTSRRLLFAGRQPTALQTTDRTTSECILRALRNVRQLVPGLDTVAGLFEHYVRVAVPRQWFSNPGSTYCCFNFQPKNNDQKIKMQA